MQQLEQKSLGSFEEKFFKKNSWNSLHYSSVTSYKIYACFMDSEDVIYS